MSAHNEAAPSAHELCGGDTGIQPVLRDANRMRRVLQDADIQRLRTAAGEALRQWPGQMKQAIIRLGKQHGTIAPLRYSARRCELSLRAAELRSLGSAVTVRQWSRLQRINRAEAEQSLAELEREGFGRWTWHKPTGKGRPTFRFEVLGRDRNTGLCDTIRGVCDTNQAGRDGILRNGDAMSAAAVSSHDGGAASTDCMLAQAIVAISRMPLSPEERVDLVRQLSVTPAGGGQTVSSADGPLSPQATGEPSGRKGKRIPRDRAERIIAKHLATRPHDTARETADAVGVSVGLVGESWAWKANRARLRQARVEAKDPIAISLKDYLTKAGDSPTSQRRAAMDEQATRDDELDRRESELFALIGEVRQRKPDAPAQAIARELDCTSRDVERYDSRLARLQAEQNADDG